MGARAFYTAGSSILVAILVRPPGATGFCAYLRIWRLRNGDDCLAGAGSSTGRGYRSSLYVVVAAGSPWGERSGCLKIRRSAAIWSRSNEIRR